MPAYKIGPAPTKELADMTDKELYDACTENVLALASDYYFHIPPQLYARLRERFAQCAGIKQDIV